MGVESAKDNKRVLTYEKIRALEEIEFQSDQIIAMIHFVTGEGIDFFNRTTDSLQESYLIAIQEKGEKIKMLAKSI